MLSSRTPASRRALLTSGAALMSLPVSISVPDERASAATPRLRRDPFTLGVASGDPSPDGFVIWTRLAPQPLAEDGLGGMPSRRVRVDWQVATDRRFTDVVLAGSSVTGPASAHAVHVEVAGLLPGRPYYYRFRIDGWTSRRGRAVTAPAVGSLPASLSMAFTSCANYPAGYFTAYRHLAAERPDLILQLGDYVYEGRAAANALGRSHVGRETRTLADYRRRHAQYKTDPDLQLAHAAAPWLVVWDDHEVENNYADDVPQQSTNPAGFLDRRAAAYRAYYENMPLRRTSVPNGPDMQLFRRISWGSLATFHMLDTRQYRSDQACGDQYQDCPEAADPARSLPGAAQEEWLIDGFRRSEARWDLLGQQVFFGRRDTDPGAADPLLMDAWDGYPASRDRVVTGWMDAGVRNPVVLTGDVHAHWASEVLADFRDPASPVVGSELVTSSITSGGNGYDSPDGQHPWAAWNPNLKFWTNLRGYVSTTITPETMTADVRCVPSVTTPDSDVFTRARFLLQDGVRGLQQVADSPLPARSLARRSLPGDDRIIADTIREETAS